MAAARLPGLNTDGQAEVHLSALTIRPTPTKYKWVEKKDDIYRLTSFLTFIIFLFDKALMLQGEIGRWTLRVNY